MAVATHMVPNLANTNGLVVPDRTAAALGEFVRSCLFIGRVVPYSRGVINLVGAVRDRWLGN